MAFAEPQRPLEGSLASALTGESFTEARRAAETVEVALNLTQLVALVSATLAAADVALVNAARWELLHDEIRSQLHYARATMLEALAEKFARASRNTNEDKR
jgi:hypothetical protein